MPHYIISTNAKGNELFQLENELFQLENELLQLENELLQLENELLQLVKMRHLPRKPILLPAKLLTAPKKMISAGRKTRNIFLLQALATHQNQLSTFIAKLLQIDEILRTNPECLNYEIT